ncbi:TPM domain-containing protein, partial [bacterium]|nr:TPM domain-containing protein [bacterium]
MSLDLMRNPHGDGSARTGGPTRRVLAVLAATAIIALTAAPASAQEAPPACPEYDGITCEGWVTDVAGVIIDDDRVEAAVGAVVGKHGHEIAVVIVDSTGIPPDQYADELGNTWGVGSVDRNDGIVILVSLGDHRTEIVTGSGLTLQGLDQVAGAGNTSFQAGDFDGGIIAIVGSLDALLSTGSTEPDGGMGSGIDAARDETDETEGAGRVGSVIVGLLLIGGGSAMFLSARTTARRRVQTRRRDRIDQELARLEPAGHELPQLAEYALSTPANADLSIRTGDATAALAEVIDRHRSDDIESLTALWRLGALEVIEAGRLEADHEVPLELRASGERRMLEDAVQAAAQDALAIGHREESEFGISVAEVGRLVDALRPHRVAAGRRRLAEALVDSLVPTAIGSVSVTDLGERLARASAALDTNSSIEDSVAELSAAYLTASGKTERLQSLYDRLPDSTTRPAVAAALADLDEDPDEAVERYERLRRELAAEGSSLTADGLEVPAIAALLLMNRDEGNVLDFVRVYGRRRSAGSPPAEAVEYALTGLRDPDEIERIRRLARDLELPISVTAALMRRRDDGVEVFRRL